MRVHFIKSGWMDTLYQRWLRVAPRVSNIDNKRNITIMKDGLKKCCLKQFRGQFAGLNTTYATNFNNFGDTLLHNSLENIAHIQSPDNSPWFLLKASCFYVFMSF